MPRLYTLSACELFEETVANFAEVLAMNGDGFHPKEIE
jgi:hypothetical protein